MRNKEIVIAMIRKAYPDSKNIKVYETTGNLLMVSFRITKDTSKNIICNDEVYIDIPVIKLVFTYDKHSFVKRFWGKEKVDDFGSIVKFSTLEQYKKAYPDGSSNYLNAHDCVSEGRTWYTRDQYSTMPYAWQYHLQQAVLEDNYLKYIERFL
jgi:hypothetical protein